MVGFVLDKLVEREKRRGRRRERGRRKEEEGVGRGREWGRHIIS